MLSIRIVQDESDRFKTYPLLRSYMNLIGEADPGQRLLVRIDINAPVTDGRVQDHNRFARHAETIEQLLAADHAVALLAHQGRPGRDTFLPLEQHAELLSGYLETPVKYVSSVYDDAALSAIDELGAGDALLLDNVRFVDAELADRSPEEHAKTPLVRTLADQFDAYVNDGYSVAHRAHASIVGFPHRMPAYAGPVMATEYEYNTSLHHREFDGPVTMVLGGKKADDVIEAMAQLADRVDRFLLGGVVGELFLRAKGYPVGYDVATGTDLYDRYYEQEQAYIEEALSRFGDRIVLPTDLAYETDGKRAEQRVDTINTKTCDFLDIGTETIETYAELINDSAAVLVKGALGVFEDERFSNGTVGVLEAIAGSNAFSVVGGGDTSRAVQMYALDPAAFDHLSIAGGAYLRALTGEPLPGVQALEAAADRLS